VTRSLALGLLLVFPALAEADFRSDFRDGVRAAERQDWAAVDRAMKSALADRATPDGGIRILGMPYAPKFYLGLAAFSTNRCREAIDWLEDPATAVVIDANSRDANRRRMMIDRCSARLAREAAPAPAPVGAAPEPATQPAPQTSATARPPAPQTSTPARPPAAQASTPARPSVPAPSGPPPKPVAAPQPSPAAAGAEALAAARALLRTQLAAYLEGRFEAAAAWSQDAALGAYPRLLAHALLARAAANLELHIRSGERDPALLARVQADLARVRQLDPALVPSSRAYPPRLRALHRSAG
jgi:hypothetical protein